MGSARISRGGLDTAIGLRICALQGTVGVAWVTYSAADFADIGLGTPGAAANVRAENFATVTFINTHANNTLYARFDAAAGNPPVAESIPVPPGQSIEIVCFGADNTTHLSLSLRGSAADTTFGVVAGFALTQTV